MSDTRLPKKHLSGKLAQRFQVTKARFKEIVTNLDAFIEKGSDGLPKRTHLHEIVSAALGVYKSNAALLSDLKNGDFYISEPFYDQDGTFDPLICEKDIDLAEARVELRSKMLGSKLSGEVVVRHINDYFAPLCDEPGCGCRETKWTPSYDEYDWSYCEPCLEKQIANPESAIGKCVYCSNVGELNAFDECREHSGKTIKNNPTFDGGADAWAGEPDQVEDEDEDEDEAEAEEGSAQYDIDD